MTAPGGGGADEIREQKSWGDRLSFAAGLAVARARRGLLTVKEIRAALDEAYRQGQASVRVEDRRVATLQLIARAEGAAAALNAASHEVDDGEDAQLLARRAMQWEREVERYVVDPPPDGPP